MQQEEEQRKQKKSRPGLSPAPAEGEARLDSISTGMSLLVGTGFWTRILSPVFGAGLSQITRFWTNRIPAAVPDLKGKVNEE